MVVGGERQEKKKEKTKLFQIIVNRLRYKDIKQTRWLGICMRELLLWSYVRSGYLLYIYKPETFLRID